MPAAAEAPKITVNPVRHPVARPESHGGSLRPASFPERQNGAIHLERPRNKEFPKAENTCVHELLHAIVLERLGYMPREVSVEEDKDSGSLGRVIVSGWMDPKDFQIFAAASSVVIEGYSPKGTGSDRAQIHALERYGGHTFDGARNAAERIISSFEAEEIHRAAILLGQVGNVRGSVSGLLAQARYEIKMEHGETDDSMSFIFEHQRNQEEKAVNEEQTDEPERTTMIETLTGDRGRVSLYEGNVLIGQETYCSLCGGRGDSHTAECAAHKPEVTTEEKVTGRYMYRGNHPIPGHRYNLATPKRLPGR